MNAIPHIPESHQRPWTALNDIDEVKTWIANCNLELRYYIEEDRNSRLPKGQGICFALELGGEIFVHTTMEGIILLDVTDDAAWATPVIISSTGAKEPKGQIWILPEGSLIQLVLGLNSLIASTTLVLQHDYGSPTLAHRH